MTKAQARSIDQILEEPEHSTAKLFIGTKVLELGPFQSLDGRQWLFRLLRGWTGTKIWKEIKTNRRKMEVVYKLYKAEYYGYGLEQLPDKTVRQEFRGKLRVEMAKFNKSADQSRKKFLAHKGVMAQRTRVQYEESENEGYFNQNRAKLSNKRTAQRKIAQKKRRRDDKPLPYLTQPRHEDYYSTEEE